VAILAAVAGCAGHRQGSHGLHPATQVSVYLSLADTVTVTGSDSGQCPAFEKPDTTAACQLGTLAAGASVTVSLPVTYSNPYQETPGWWGMLQPRMGSQKYHDAQFTFGNLS